MRARVSPWAIATVLVMWVAPLSGQVTTVAPGTPVHLTLTGPGSVNLVGWVDCLHDDTLALFGQVPTGSLATPGSRGRYRVVHWEVLISEIDSLQVRNGMYAHTGRGLLYGALAGLATGAAIGVTSGSDQTMSAQTKAVDWGISFGVIGAGIEGLIGSRLHYETWVSVPPTLLRVEPVAPQGPGVTVSLTLPN